MTATVDSVPACRMALLLQRHVDETLRFPAHNGLVTLRDVPGTVADRLRQLPRVVRILLVEHRHLVLHTIATRTGFSARWPAPRGKG